jgi:N-acetylmuramoyl-L-alanine amidase
MLANGRSLLVRKFIAWLALAVLAGCCAVSLAAAGELAKIDGVNYIDVAAFSERFGLHAKWLEPEKRILLQNAGTRVELEANLRDMIFDGRRAFMGSPAIYREHSVWISLIDAEKLLRPFLRLGLDHPPPVHTIVIDPGHGILDNGAENIRLGLKERVLTLDTAFRLKRILEAQGYKVVLTRATDQALSPNKMLDLRMRAALTARVQADLFISIHFNSAGQYVPGENVAAVHGTETFRFTPRYQIPIRRSIHRPEDDDPNPGNKNDFWNTLLGYSIHRSLLGRIGSYDRGLRHDQLAVLRLASCPAVLVESGYLTNDAEARKIATPAYRQQIAEGIAAGIRAYAALGSPQPAPARAPSPASAPAPPPSSTAVK